MNKVERDIEFELQHFTGEAVAKAHEEVNRIKNKCIFRLNYGYQKLKTIRKELNLLSRMTTCKQTKNEIFRLSQDVKDIYEKLGDRL